jgi:hypothetical protein
MLSKRLAVIGAKKDEPCSRLGARVGTSRVMSRGRAAGLAAVKPNWSRTTATAGAERESHHRQDQERRRLRATGSVRTATGFRS